MLCSSLLFDIFCSVQYGKIMLVLTVALVCSYCHVFGYFILIYSSTKTSWGQALELLVNEYPEKVSTHFLVDLDILVSGFDMIGLTDSQTSLML